MARRSAADERAYQAKWAKANPEKVNTAYRKWRLKDQYNITPEEYDAILEVQGGGCAICGAIRKEGGRYLAVDHDHKTGLTRGILCWQCNNAVGAFRDNTERLQRAAHYITNPPATAVLGGPRFGRKGRVNRARGRGSKRSKN